MATDKNSQIDVAKAISELPRLSLAELRARWKMIFRRDVPIAFGPDLLRRSIAYKIQELTFGGLNTDINRVLDRLAKTLANNPETKLELPRRIKLGCELVREWKGKSHRVTVGDGGFLYDGKTYTNLSEIARQITGSRWNGPRFFGLRKPVDTETKRNPSCNLKAART